MTGVNRDVLRNLVVRWQQQELSERDVHEEAERLWDARDTAEYPRDDPRSIALEVLAQLEILNLQLVTVDDVPAIVDFLNTPGGEEAAGWAQWHNYWSGVDFEARRERLRDHPYYAV